MTVQKPELTAVQLLVTALIQTLVLNGTISEQDLLNVKDLACGVPQNMGAQGGTFMQIGGDRVNEELRKLFSVLVL